MNPSSSEQSAAVQELNQLFEEGAEKGLWENNKAACGRVIGVERRDMSRLLHGHRADEEVMPILQKMRDMVRSGVPSEVLGQQDSENDEEQAEAQTEFDRYYQRGLQQGLWKGPGSCAEALGINRATVRKYRQTSAETLSGTSPKGKTAYKKNMEKMRGYVQRRKGPQVTRRPDAGASEAQAEKVSEAPRPIPQSIPATQTTGHPPADLASIISYPAIARIDDLEARLPALIQSALAQSGHDRQPVPEGVVPSEWAERILAGRMEVQDQKQGDVRFVVTAGTFRKLLSQPLSGAEVADTQAVASISANADTELRRRLEVLHQMEKSPQRAEAIQALVPALSERIRQAVALAITIEKIQECDVAEGLTRAARRFESLNIF